MLKIFILWDHLLLESRFNRISFETGYREWETRVDRSIRRDLVPVGDNRGNTKLGCWLSTKTSRWSSSVILSFPLGAEFHLALIVCSTKARQGSNQPWYTVPFDVEALLPTDPPQMGHPLQQDSRQGFIPFEGGFKTLYTHNKNLLIPSPIALLNSLPSFLLGICFLIWMTLHFYGFKKMYLKLAKQNHQTRIKEF